MEVGELTTQRLAEEPMPFTGTRRFPVQCEDGKALRLSSASPWETWGRRNHRHRRDSQRPHHQAWVQGERQPRKAGVTDCVGCSGVKK